MIEVTKDQFYRAIGPENVHPRPERECSVWEVVGTRRTIGRSEPGYASPYGTPRRYWLAADFAKGRKVLE